MTNQFKEIERKFLLSAHPEIPENCSLHYKYEQGFLPGITIKERLTIQYLDGAKFRRAVKIGSGIERLEFNDPISEEFFWKLWPLTEGRRIKKERWCIPTGELVWEVDRYRDRTLSIAEVELPHADYPLEIPDWLKGLVVREVTQEKEFEGFFMGI